jgi:site-specific recombinase XerD
MTHVLAPMVGSPARSWVEVLADAVRPEFAVPVYWPARHDPVLWPRSCRVGDCLLEAGAFELCHLHRNRWRAAGSPDLDTFAQGQVGRPRRGAIRKCAVGPCPRSTNNRGLCAAHLARWRWAGMPDQQGWAQSQGAVSAYGESCLVGTCPFPAVSPKGLCDAHANRFRAGRDGDRRAYALAQAGRRRGPCFDMSRLGGIGLTEAQFVLQQRHDEGRSILHPRVFDRLVDHLAACGGSMLDGSDAERCAPLDDPVRHLLRYGRNRLGMLRDGEVMDWDADTWDLRLTLGPRWRSSAGRTLRFGEIPQPWLRALAKRWVRLRLASRSQATVGNSLHHVAIFAGFLNQHGLASTVDTLRREDIEAFLAWLAGSGFKHNSQAGVVSSVRTFLDDCGSRGWADDMARTARIFPGEGARYETGLPRFISEDVMCQLEDPANVARWPTPDTRNLFLVLRETGKRVGEVVSLGRDPVLLDSTGAPCLLYHDFKSRRDAIVPISETAAAAIRDQQAVVEAKHPQSPWLFPRPIANADGSRHWNGNEFNRQLNRWMRTCGVVDASGKPVTVSSHQFRHTMATRMLNLGVPQHIVQQMLGHATADTVATYARLSDKTMRREFERFQHERVNIRGEVVSYSDSSPTAEAEWVKHRISKALQALANGECGRPIQQECPHPNACLTCDDFLTDSRYLHAHQDQLARTRKLIATADSAGNVRMVEMNRRVEQNLNVIIDTIERRGGTAADEQS